MFLHKVDYTTVGNDVVHILYIRNRNISSNPYSCVCSWISVKSAVELTIMSLCMKYIFQMHYTMPYNLLYVYMYNIIHVQWAVR